MYGDALGGYDWAVDPTTPSGWGRAVGGVSSTIGGARNTNRYRPGHLGDFNYTADPTDPTGIAITPVGGTSTTVSQPSTWDNIVGGAQDIAGVVNSIFGPGGAFSNQPYPPGYTGSRAPGYVPPYRTPLPSWLLPALLLGGVALLARKRR